MARMQESGTAVPGRLSLKKAIRDCLEDLVPLAEAKNLDLGVIGDVDPFVAGNAVDITILIKNLVDNAIRYTPEGGRVDIRLEEEGGRAILDIDDSGPGIPAAERGRVFDPFYRVLGNGQIGSGLGLAIASAIAQRSGAAIALLDKPDGSGGLRARVSFA